MAGCITRHCERSEQSSFNIKESWIASSLVLLAMTEEAASRRHDFITDDDELEQIHPPENRGQRQVGGVAAGPHQDAADTRLVVTGVAGEPFAGQIDLEPAGEIHRIRIV